MLVRFRVSNFLSFNRLQEFSMIAGKVKNKENHVVKNGKMKLLKFAAVYGANASGKSNLIKAIQFARDLICDCRFGVSNNQYCRTNAENKEKCSYFDFEIKIGEEYYSYGFEALLSQACFKSEWLIKLNEDGTEEEIFTRDVENSDYKLNKKYFKTAKNYDRLEIYAEDIKSNGSILFINSMNQNKNDLYNEQPELSIFKDVFKWFNASLDVNYPDRPISPYSYFMSDKKSSLICDLISEFGTGICDFETVNVKMDYMINRFPKEMIDDIIEALNNNKASKKSHSILMRSIGEFFVFDKKEDAIEIKTIQFKHENINGLFSMTEESDGTKRLLDLIEILLTTQKNKVYFIDEIDRCLHPQLTYKFIETYLNLAKESNIQLVVTTHESHLMDFDLLRRDEIWFVDKGRDGATNVYSLEDYNVRIDKKIDAAYLDGRYGGVPIFSTVFPVKGAQDENTK